jgi:hypothetical protein
MSISSGSNFLKKIESALINCTAAIYLISPLSVKRSWINFELGAIWIRSALQESTGEAEIPLIPICHSGITPSMLPSPLNNLNGINGAEASSLERAFKSIQYAMGGKGKLKTEFDVLASKIKRIEDSYTVGRNLKEFLTLIMGDNVQSMIEHFKSQTGSDNIIIDIESVEQNSFRQAQEILLHRIPQLGIEMTSKSTALMTGAKGSHWAETANIKMHRRVLTQYESDILKP